MNGQVGPAAEGLATLITVIGFFSSVNSLVLSEVRFCAEDFKALITFIDFHSKVISFRFNTTGMFFSKNVLLRS